VTMIAMHAHKMHAGMLEFTITTRTFSIIKLPALSC
jgi:hypothetical protein